MNQHSTIGFSHWSSFLSAYEYKEAEKKQEKSTATDVWVAVLSLVQYFTSPHPEAWDMATCLWPFPQTCPKCQLHPRVEAHSSGITRKSLLLSPNSSLLWLFFPFSHSFTPPFLFISFIISCILSFILVQYPYKFIHSIVYFLQCSLQ